MGDANGSVGGRRGDMAGELSAIVLDVQAERRGCFDNDYEDRIPCAVNRCIRSIAVREDVHAEADGRRAATASE